MLIYLKKRPGYYLNDSTPVIHNGHRATEWTASIAAVGYLGQDNLAEFIYLKAGFEFSFPSLTT